MTNNKQKRITHVMKYRDNVFHNLFWRDDWSVYRSNVSGITACNRFIFKGEHDDKVKNWGDYKNICDTWDNHSYYTRWRKETCIAVVNREEHFILISSVADNGNFGWNLRQAAPSNYDVYYYEGLITNPRITDKKYRNQMLRGIATYLIKQFVTTNTWVFKLAYTDLWYCGDWVIEGRAKPDTSHSNFDFDNFRKRYFNKDKVDDFYNSNLNIFQTIDKIPNSIKNAHLLNKLYIYVNTSWNNQQVALTGDEIPTIKEIATNSFLDKKHRDIVNKKYFYSMFCRGTLFPHSKGEVDYYWNTAISDYNDKLAEGARAWDGGRLKKWIANYRKFGEEPKWQDCVFAFYKDYIEVINKVNHENEIKSIENYKKALTAWLKEHNEDIASKLITWREHKYSNNAYRDFNYMRWHPSTIRVSGYWYRAEEYTSNNRFQNTQLRLSTDKMSVETSRYCAVPLQSAVRLYAMFKGVTKLYGEKPIKDVKIDFSNKNIRVGSYQLLSMKYTEKVTDDNMDLGFKDWIVQVGCHRLWITDFIDFVNYYKLNNLFGIKNG